MAEESSGAVAGPPLTTPKVELQNLLSVGLAANLDGVALFTDGKSWTFAQLDRASDNVARGYLRLGAKPGDRIASLLPNCPELLVHYVACLKAGFVLVPANFRYTPPEIDHALELSGASILVATVDREEDLGQLTVQPSLGTVVLGQASDDAGYLATFASLMQGGSSIAKHPVSDGDTPAVIFFTSGSTGKPKGVTHTYATYGHCLASMIQALDITGEDVMMPASSCSHAAGFLYSLSALAVGAPVVVAANGTADVVLPLFRTAKPTICFFLPSFLLMLVRDKRAKREDFASVRLMQSGGDKVARLLQKECHKITGRYISEIMGMSEAAPITVHGESEPEDKRGSIGRVAPGLSVSVRDVATRQEVPLGEDGRMWIKGPLVMSRYWDNPEATSSTFDDGDWMDTGDVVKADKDGYVWFCGRQKMIIVHDGSNISPLEVEDVLMTHDAVDQAGVVGVPDVVHGENVHAFVTLKEGVAKPSEEEMIKHCKLQIGYKAPERVKVLSAMPLNPTGKVDRAALKDTGEPVMPAMVQMIARKWMRNILMRRASAEARRRSSMVEWDIVSPELLQLLEEEECENDSE
ncbi:hypothetical protein ACHAXT_003205 [Thalassiosira profunda]